MILSLGGCLGGGGGSSLPDDAGGACADMGGAYCARAVDCGFLEASDELSCQNDFQRACCTDDGTCQEPLREDISAGEWNACVDGVYELACPDVDSGNLPSQCLGL